MVQLFDLTAGRREKEASTRQTGQNLLLNALNNIQQPLQQRAQQSYQKERLQDAFSKLQPGGNFIEQLKAIAPDLLSTPGGAQALGELSPILGKFAQSEATRNAINNRRNSNQSTNQQRQPLPGFQVPGQNANVPPALQQQQQPMSEEDKYLTPSDPSSMETTFPQQSAGPQPQPEMSPQEEENYALDLMEQSEAMGTPIDYSTALNNARNANQLIKTNNDRIEQQKVTRNAGLKQLTSGVVERANNAGLLIDPEDRTVAEKLAIQSKNAPNETDSWEYVRTGMKQFDSAKNSIKRKYNVPNPIESTYRKMLGSFKEKEQAIDDLQPDLDKLRKYGLYDEARDILSGDVGLGAEDTELALFPFKGKGKVELEKFSPNKVTPKGSFVDKINPSKYIPENDFTRKSLSDQFPGEDYIMPQKDFSSFKDNLQSYLKSNPKVNLIALRGQLNQGKKYAWQDIYRAIDQLTEEKQFTPNIEQDKEMRIIREAPLPGLMQQFKYFFTGTK